MDVVLALLPWKVIWPLNMKRNEKIGVLIAMSMGLFAAATAFVKITQIPRMKSGDICKSLFSLRCPRPSWKPAVTDSALVDGVVLVIWSAAESSVTIMAASVPVLRSLLKNSKSTKPKPPPLQARPFKKKPLFNPESFTMQSQSTVVIESKRRSVDTRRSFHWKSVSTSESASARASIEMPPVEGKILQISEVAVEYSCAKDVEMGMQHSCPKDEEMGMEGKTISLT